MIQYDKNFDNNSILLFVIFPQSVPARRQVQFCHDSIPNSIEKGKNPCKQEFPEERIRRQILDHYLKGICNITHITEYSVLKSCHHKQIKHHIK